LEAEFVDSDRVLTDYLLGKLDEASCDEIEQRYFANPEALEEITAIEEQLFEDYAAGKLQADDRLRFEQRFLKTQEDHDKLHFIRSLTDWTRHARRQKPWFAFSWWPDVEAVMAQESVDGVTIEAGKDTSGDLIVEIPAEGLFRLETEIEGALHRSYWLVVKNNEGRELSRSQMTHTMRPDLLRVHIPCSLLSDGRYNFTVYSPTDAATGAVLEMAIQFRRRSSGV
jgi:hypothetical protein